MNLEELAAFVERVLAEAADRFGPAADPALLEAFAREAAIDLWQARPTVTVAVAGVAYGVLRERIGRPARRDGVAAHRGAGAALAA